MEKKLSELLKLVISDCHLVRYEHHGRHENDALNMDPFVSENSTTMIQS